MGECAFCGQPLRPGATFCAACGHAAPAPAAPGAKPPRFPPPASGSANPRAALAILAMPVVLFVSIFTFMLIGPGPFVDWDAFIIMGFVSLFVGGAAYAVWRGQAWARWLSIVATLGWAAFMVWMIPEQAQQLDDPFLSSYPEARRNIVFGLVLSCAELAIAAAALYFLFFPGKLRAQA